MDHLQHNRHAWNRESAEGGKWSIPVDAETIARARAGDWSVVLTPSVPVPRDWFGDLRGKKVLCLASGGGQQVPVLAAAGAEVLSFDLSDEQLAKDRLVADREGLAVQCVQGDMADLSALSDGSFDLVFNPASNVFAPELAPIWRGCHRVLRPGGELLVGFMNPSLFMFDDVDAEAGSEAQLVAKYPLPFADTTSLSTAELQAKIDTLDQFVYSHSLETQIGGQIQAGFVITGLYEDRFVDETWLYSRFAPVSVATRARRPL